MGVAAAGVALLLVVALWSVHRARQLARLAAPAQALEELRTDLARQARSIRLGRSVLLGLTIATLGLVLGWLGRGAEISPLVARWLVVGGLFGAVGIAVLLWVQAVKLPRAERELADLGPGTEG